MQKKTSIPLYGILFLSAVLSCLVVQAQTGTLKGSVKNESGEPLVQATLLVQGKNKNAITNESGIYTLVLAPGTYTIVASYTGQKTAEQKVTVTTGQETTADFILVTATDMTEVLVIGSRSPLRVSTETAVPVDIINVSALATSAPQANLTQILNYVAPSFTSNASTVADGTDHIDPAQLRGLGPDPTGTPPSPAKHSRSRPRSSQSCTAWATPFCRR